MKHSAQGLPNYSLPRNLCRPSRKQESSQKLYNHCQFAVSSSDKVINYLLLSNGALTNRCWSIEVHPRFDENENTFWWDMDEKFSNLQIFLSLVDITGDKSSLKIQFCFDGANSCFRKTCSLRNLLLHSSCVFFFLLPVLIEQSTFVDKKLILHRHRALAPNNKHFVA